MLLSGTFAPCRVACSGSTNRLQKAVQPAFISLKHSRERSRAYSTDQSPPPRRSRLSLGIAATVLAAGVSGLYYLNQPDAPVLAPDRWTPVKVIAVEQLTRDTSLLRINVPKSTLPTVLTQDPDAQPILSLYVKEPTLQIQRAYTPLSASCFNPDGSATLELVVKRYRDGEVSRYLHRLGPGDELSIRAPSVTWYYRPKDWDQVVFIAGGTGVTPAYQLIHDSLESQPSSRPSPTLSLLYASASPAQMFLQPQLDAFLSSGARASPLSIRYQVDSNPEGARLAPNMHVGKIDRKVLQEVVGTRDPSKKKVIVICGPEGMINALAGPRGRNFSQGRVGGILKELGYSEHEVVKL
ncbi:cytochrome b5 reductase family protein [Sporobolomyces koalae]|uniref:cytochrome b5 reductase family protein n=1 Tax=Sporobolomyces koalae TaxID=500713 RepID=UPI003182AD9C